MSTTIIESLFHLLILSPLFIWGWQKNKTDSLKPIIYFVLIYVIINLLLTSFSDETFFQGQKWNWVGKGVALLAELLFIILIPAFNKRSFGLTTKINWTGSRTLLTFCFIYFLIRVGIYIFSGEATTKIDLETILFQATMPGIQEEILYRGILLGLLNAVFALPVFKFLKINFGPAVIITSLLFGLAHGIKFHENFSFNLNYFAFFRTVLDGFLFAMLVEKTKSVFPSIVFHNMLNLIGLH